MIHLSKPSRVGTIVSASLTAGLLLAVVLVLLPFAGAREHVIAGVTLLCFALGWCLLGVLSMRFSEQPQRWARIPALLFALIGSVMILWPGSVTHEYMGWLWPFVVLGLVTWMVMQSRRHLRSRARSLLLYPVFGVLALASTGGTYENVQEHIDRGNLAMPGRLIDVGGHRLHLHCTGTGSPTVILEAGLGEPSSMMSGWIQPNIARDTRVCSYDRAGRGWSDAAKHDLDGIGVARDLRTLLERAGEEGPFILASHSAGGAYALIFAKLFPHDVAGLVLLDSMHPEQRTRLQGWETFYQTFRRASSLLPSISRIGVGRLMFLTAGADLPPEERTQERAFLSTARHARSLRGELSELPTALTQAGELKTLGERPLVVITAGKDAQAGWQTLQDELAALSSNAIQRTIPDATHPMLVEDEGFAEVSSQAIRDLIMAVRAGDDLATR